MMPANDNSMKLCGAGPLTSCGAHFELKKGTSLNDEYSRASFMPAEVSVHFLNFAILKKGTG